MLVLVKRNRSSVITIRTFKTSANDGNVLHLVNILLLYKMDVWILKTANIERFEAFEICFHRRW